MTCWTVVTRSKREKKRTIQTFVKVNESRTFPPDVSTDDKVNDVIRQIQSEEDVYVTMHGEPSQCPCRIRAVVLPRWRLPPMASSYTVDIVR